MTTQNWRHFKEAEWLKLAKQASWSATTLAALCNMSNDTLYRHFIEQMGRPPGVWLAKHRQEYALELMRNGASVKEAALSVGYKQQTNFTRKFKQLYGFSPSTTSKLVWSELAVEVK